MKNEIAEQTAHQNAKLKVEFRIHLATYIAVNTFLAIINVLLSPDYLWVIWPVSGWGIGLLIHAIKVHASTGSSLKQRMIEKEMKRVSMIISFIVLMANMQAQDTKTLFTSDRPTVESIIGYGGPLISFTGLNNDLGLTVGGKGGAIFNETFAFGGIGFGTVNPIDFSGTNLSDIENTPLQMSYGAGGVFFEYIFNFGDLVQFSIPVNIMAGGINIYENSAKIESSAFFVIEPGISVDLNVTNFYTQSLFITYRQALGSSLVNLDDRNISGLNVGLIFKFGAK